MPGPPPDPYALRRNLPSDRAGWIILPEDGYSGRIPDWPLSHDSPNLHREAALWEQAWRKPQAMMWDRLGQTLQVALYCRNLAAAELPDAAVALQVVILRQLDSLGLSTQGLLRNRWRIEPADPPAPAVKPSGRKSARDRLSVVAPGEDPSGYPPA